MGVHKDCGKTSGLKFSGEINVFFDGRQINRNVIKCGIKRTTAHSSHKRYQKDF